MMRGTSDPLAHFIRGAGRLVSQLLSWRLAWIWLLVAPIACGGGGGGGDAGTAMSTGGTTTGSSSSGGSTTTTGGGSSTTGSGGTGSATGGTGSTSGGGSSTTSGGSGTSSGGSGSTSGGGSSTVSGYTANWYPSTSSDVTQYELAVWTNLTDAVNGINPSGSYTISASAAGASSSIAQALSYFFPFVPVAGTTYYLRMRAWNTAGLASEYSNMITVAPATTLSGVTSGGSGSSTSGSTSTSGGSGSTLMGSTSGSTGSGSTSGSGSSSSGSSSMTSVDLDGVSEYLASTTAQPTGFAGAYTVSVWVKSGASDGVRRGIMALRGSAQVPGSLELAAQGLALQLSVYGAGGSVTFQASYPDVLLQGEWQNLVVSFDSQLDSVPAVFVDGVLEAAGSTSGSVAGFSDGARRVYLGTGAEGMAQPWQGRIGHTAVWDAALGDDEILVIALGGHAIDLAQPSGAYHGQDALLHYWKPGADPAAPGFDFGPASSPINLDDPAGNVDATDVAPDAPVLVQ